MLSTSLLSNRLQLLPFPCSPIITFPREGPEGVIISSVTWKFIQTLPPLEIAKLHWLGAKDHNYFKSSFSSSILGAKHPSPMMEAAELRVSTQSWPGPTRANRSSSEVRSHHLFEGKHVVRLSAHAVFVYVSRRAANELQVAGQVPQRPGSWGKQHPSDFQMNLPG